MFGERAYRAGRSTKEPADTSEAGMVSANEARAPYLQPKLEVGSVDDSMEHEADAVADRVMRTPDRFVQRKCAECENEERLQKKDNGSGHSPSVSEGTDHSIRSSSGAGPGMDGETQSFMSSRMGHDFSDVKIHTDREAVRMNRELSAKAFTVGRDIYFNEGEYQPGSQEGRHLLAHELTHTVQQGGSTGLVQRKDDYSTDRAAILKALREFDSPTALHILHDLNELERELFLVDNRFWQDIQSAGIHGNGLWSAFTIVYFAGKMSLPQRRLAIALFNRSITDVMDAIAVIIVQENIPEDIYWNLLLKAVSDVFNGDLRMMDVLQLITSRGKAYAHPNTLTYSANEVHYEKDKSGNYAIQSFGGGRQAIGYTTSKEFRAVVTILLTNGDDPKGPAPFQGEDAGIPATWASKIQSVWNNKFELSNGIDTKQFVVAPVFTYEHGQENDTVMIKASKDSTCPGVIQAGRENSGCWFVHTDPVIVAHEFGHLLGANDEYNLPKTTAEIPAAQLAGLSPVDQQLTTLAGLKALDPSLGSGVPTSCNSGPGSCVKSLMNDKNQSTEVYGRHILMLVSAFNSNLPPGVPPYNIRKK
jgi:hypothetical protein